MPKRRTEPRIMPSLALGRSKCRFGGVTATGDEDEEEKEAEDAGKMFVDCENGSEVDEVSGIEVSVAPIISKTVEELPVERAFALILKNREVELWVLISPALGTSKKKKTGEALMSKLYVWTFHGNWVMFCEAVDPGVVAVKALR